MDLIVKHFNELSTTELYEILKTRFEIFVTEQECIYQDLDDKDQDAIHVFGDVKVSGTEEVLTNWEEIKKKEKEKRRQGRCKSVFAGSF